MKTFRKGLLPFLEKWKHLWLLLYFVFYLIWFAYLEATVTTQFHVIHLTIDDYIPFCEYFVIPYFLWFAYVAWGVIHTALHNREDYYKLCVVLFTGMTVFLVVSTVYPNGHTLRPHYFTHHNFCTTLVNYLYSTDTPTNLFPSIHVYNSLAVHFMVMNSRDFKHKKTVRLTSLFLCVSIIMSTVFLKQHSMFDVITALVLGSAMYEFVYVHNWAVGRNAVPRQIHGI
ncbi:MAG: phosphatase PAP2 family protein [Agathobacter sp.]|nr:phosphatase PAP2 family protein [Agathobacter sp.]